MILLLGESACGKSKAAKALESLGYKKIVTYTTREPRLEDNEIDGVDYHFISDKEFTNLKESGFFGETGCYRGWNYGSGINTYVKNGVMPITPHGLRQIVKKNIAGLDLSSFYIYVPRRDRLIKILQRGDDIDESYRRNVSDIGQFDGITDEVNHVIDNAGYNKTPLELASIIHILTQMKGV